MIAAEIISITLMGAALICLTIEDIKENKKNNKEIKKIKKEIKKERK